MPRIRPFRGLYYSKEKVGDLSQVVTPPYDVISPERKEEFLRRHPLNIVRLILPEGPEEARRTLSEWLKEGVFLWEERPCLYVLEQTFPWDGITYRRWGIIALVELEEGAIDEHERTFDHVVRERLELLEATGLQTGEIFSLYSDPQGEVEALLEEATAVPPRFEVTDDEGTTHRLWALEDREVIYEVVARLQGKRLLIADGHHRFRTALALRRKRKGQERGETPYDYACMYLSRMEAPGLLILPVHRAVYGLSEEEERAIRERISRYFSLEPIDLAGLLSALREKRGIGVHWRGKGQGLLLPKGGLPVPPHLKEVDPFLVDELLLKDLSLDLHYVKGMKEALEADLAFLLRPVSAEAIRAVVGQGEVMPKKSTYFHPKVPTGLVLYRIPEDG